MYAFAKLLCKYKHESTLIKLPHFVLGLHPCGSLLSNNLKRNLMAALSLEFRAKMILGVGVEG